MDLRSYLDEMGINYQWSHHDPAYTAQDLAMKEHVPGKRVIKPVIVRADGRFVICALPASSYVDIDTLRKELNVQDARLADEDEFASVFKDCERGAEPPIGGLFGLPTVVDDSLLGQEMVTFQAGTHADAVTMRTADYLKAAHPMTAHFAHARA